MNDDELTIEEGLAGLGEAGKPTIQRVKYTHDAMIDAIVANPGIHQNQLASLFGYTPAWISIVVNSDAFQARLRQRKEELVDPTITATLEEKFRGVISQSLSILAEKLSQPAHVVPDNLALQAAALGAKSLGMGQQRENAIVVVPSDHLERLAERLTRLNERPIQGECHVVQEPAA